jgi:hypothetical protein
MSIALFGSDVNLWRARTSGENRPQPSIGVESISFRRGRCPQDLLRRRLLDSDLAFHVYHEALPSAGAGGAYSPNPTTSSAGAAGGAIRDFA